MLACLGVAVLLRLLCNGLCGWCAIAKIPNKNGVLGVAAGVGKTNKGVVLQGVGKT